MQRVLFLLLIVNSILFADTFTHKKTKETFTGYSTNIKKNDKTLVRTNAGAKVKYINIEDYEVEYNFQGRRNKIAIIYLDGEFSSQAIINACKERLDLQANQGPLLIILEIGKINDGFLPNIKTDIAGKIQSLTNAKTVAIVKEESWIISKIITSCSKTYYLKDFEKISDVYLQIANDFSLGKFKVVKDRNVAGAQKKYLSTKRKLEKLKTDMKSYSEAIGRAERRLSMFLSSHKKARDKLLRYRNDYLVVSQTAVNDYWRRRYYYANLEMKRFAKRCDDIIKNIVNLSQKTVSKSKTIFHYIDKYSEFDSDSNNIKLMLKNVLKAKKKALDIRKTIHEPI